MTLRLPATRAEAAVAALAAKTGLNLKASSTVASEVLLVNVTDVPVDGLMRRMAEAASARWERAGDGSQVLTADPAKRSAEEREVQAKRRKAIEARLKAIANELAKPADANAAPDEEDFMGSGGEAGRRMTGRVALALGVAAIEAVPAGGRIVYATAPTPMQRPLRVAGLETLVEAFVKEHNANAQASERVEEATAEERAMMDTLREIMGGRDLMPKKIEKPVTKVLAAIERRGGMFSFYGTRLSVVLYDAEGNALAEDSRELSAISEEDIEAMIGVDAVSASEEVATEEGQEKPVEKPIDPKLNVDVVLSPLSAEFVKGSRGRDSDTNEPISDALRTALLRPDETDPLAYGLSDVLIQSSELLETDLVAALPDNVFGFGAVRDSQKLGHVWRRFSESDEVKVTSDGTWTLIRAAEPATARAARLDRPALRILLDASAGRMSCPLDSMAAYAAKNPEPSESPLAMGFVTMVAPGLVSNGIPGQSDWETLRLWGRLTPDLRAALRSGSRVSLGRLPAGAMEVVNQMVYGAGATFLVGDAAAPADPFAEMMTIGMGAFGGESDWRNEPTETLPNGLPVDGFMTLTQRPTSWVVPVRPDGQPLFPMGPIGAMEIGMLTAMLELDKSGQMAASMPTFKDFVHGNRNEMRFTFMYREGLRQERKLLDDKEGDGKAVPLDGLPSGFLEEVAKAREQMKSSPFAKLFQMGGFGNRGPVTPP